MIDRCPYAGVVTQVLWVVQITMNARSHRGVPRFVVISVETLFYSVILDLDDAHFLDELQLLFFRLLLLYFAIIHSRQTEARGCHGVSWKKNQERASPGENVLLRTTLKLQLSIYPIYYDAMSYRPNSDVSLDYQIQQSHASLSISKIIYHFIEIEVRMDICLCKDILKFWGYVITRK